MGETRGCYGQPQKLPAGLSTHSMHGTLNLLMEYRSGSCGTIGRQCSHRIAMEGIRSFMTKVRLMTSEAELAAMKMYQQMLFMWYAIALLQIQRTSRKF